MVKPGGWTQPDLGTEIGNASLGSKPLPVGICGNCKTEPQHWIMYVDGHAWACAYCKYEIRRVDSAGDG